MVIKLISWVKIFLVYFLVNLQNSLSIAIKPERCHWNIRSNWNNIRKPQGFYVFSILTGP